MPTFDATSTKHTATSPKLTSGYVAAPVRSITNWIHALTRELNVGIVGVKTTRCHAR